MVFWDPERGEIDAAGLARAAPTAVLNLAGEPIARRWTSARRRRIRTSRVNGTRALATALAATRPAPVAFVSGSAIGYYGAMRGEELLDENSDPGSDFLAEVAREWEGATAPAEDAGVRVVHLRTGVVLGRGGGALERLLLPFRLGVGGRIGSGRQWMSWIALEDAVRAIRFALLEPRPTLTGPVNIVAPEPVRNEDFTRVLARVLGRPALIPAPASALWLLFGEMARNTILADQRVVPMRLAAAGFRFQQPRLEEALRSELRRSDDPAGR